MACEIHQYVKKTLKKFGRLKFNRIFALQMNKDEKIIIGVFIDYYFSFMFY